MGAVYIVFETLTNMYVCWQSEATAWNPHERKLTSEEQEQYQALKEKHRDEEDALLKSFVEE